MTGDCRVPACVMMCDAGARGRCCARGGEPFAPPFPLHLRATLQCTRGESGATGEARLCVQCAWLGSGTPQSSCVDQGRAGSPSFHARLAAQSLSPCNQVLHGRQACLHSLRAHSLHCRVAFVYARPRYVILLVAMWDAVRQLVCLKGKICFSLALFGRDLQPCGRIFYSGDRAYAWLH